MIQPFRITIECDDCHCIFDYVDSFFYNGHKLKYPQYFYTKCPNCGKEVKWVNGCLYSDDEV